MNLSKLLKRALLKVIRKFKPSYFQLQNVMKGIRAELENEEWYQKPKREKPVFMRASLAQKKAFFVALDDEKDPRWKIAALMAYGAGVRVSELVNIQIKEINFENCTIRVRKGKGSKGRLVLFPTIFKELLKFHIKHIDNKIYLFENKKKYNKPYSPRRVQQVFNAAKKRAGIDIRMSPHIGRHELLTVLTESGWTDAWLMEQSGHSDKNSVSVYQHYGNITNLRGKFDEAVTPFFQAVL